MTVLSEDDIALAGEYVLGLLDSAAKAQANARIATDPDFAAEVEAWRNRLAPMLNGADTPAPADGWSRIAAALPVETGQDRGAAGPWKWATSFSALAAVLFAALYFMQPSPVAAPTPAAPLVAALGSDTGNAAITARYDPDKGELLLTPVALETGALYPELWIIPTDGKARSLGMMADDKPTQLTVTAELRGFMEQGATLAITPEPQGGAPGGKATGPVIASGKISTI
jgi:anti-sigma-K factor RskA